MTGHDKTIHRIFSNARGKSWALSFVLCVSSAICSRKPHCLERHTRVCDIGVDSAERICGNHHSLYGKSTVIQLVSIG